MKINSISQKSGNKYQIIIDDKKYLFYDDVIIKYQLYNKKDIDEELLSQINEEQNFYVAYYKMISFLNYKMRTEKEVRNKLRTYHLGNRMINQVIERLKDENYLNKEAYLKSFVHDQINLTLNGPIKITYELKKLDFRDDDIASLLDNIDNEVWLDKMNKIVQKKLKSNHTLSCKMFNIKINVYLKQMGYSSQLIDQLEPVVFDDSIIKQKTYEKLYKNYQKKCKDSDIENAIKEKLYQMGFEI